jgi:large subunit ribosomal protein L15
MGSGHGKTSARGYNGQLSRSGASVRPGFEGGQMPLHRRLPKRGFTNIFRKEYAAINLEQLAGFEAGAQVTPEILKTKGIVRNLRDGLKVLGVENCRPPYKSAQVQQECRRKNTESGRHH